MLKLAIVALLGLLFASPAYATTYYVRGADGNDSNTGLVDSAGGAWKTISKCAATMVGGDTCIVATNTSYDEAVTEATSGSSGNRITYRAATDCVSNSGTTVAGSCAKVRRWAVSGAYVTVQGFEITNQGLSHDANRPVLVNNNNFELINNYIHHGGYGGECTNLAGTDMVARGNRIVYCAPFESIVATNFGPFNIQTGVNDKISVSVQGGAAETITLTAGAARTTVNIQADVEAAKITGLDTCGGFASCEQVFNMFTTTFGNNSSIELLAVANDAYTTLGMTVGRGEIFAGGPGFSGTSTNWLVENNYLEHVSDCFTPGNSTKVVFRDNVCGENDYTPTHVDMVQPGGADQVLVENVVARDGVNVQHHMLHNEVASSHYIFRFVRTCRHRGSLYMGTGTNYFYFYNNTFYDNFDVMLGVDGAQLRMSSAANQRSLGRNNIWKNSRQNAAGVYNNDGGAAATDHDYDLWWEITDPGGSNNVNADPLVSDEANCDFTLQAGSPAIDQGGPLTTVAAGDSGSGTTLVLSDARMFQDGWAGVTPDAIAVGTVSNVAQITAIDYATGEVTIASDIVRNDGDSVWLYRDSRGTRVLYGDAPDIGAFESTEEAPGLARPRIRGEAAVAPVGEGGLSAVETSRLLLQQR